MKIKEVKKILQSLVNEEWLGGDEETDKKIQDSIEKKAKEIDLIYQGGSKGQLS